MKPSASIDIQKEIEKIRNEFEKLKSKATPEIQILFEALFSIVNLICLAFMAKTTKKDSRNSSIPPSQDPHRIRKKKNSNGKIGAPNGHKGSTLLQTDNPDELIKLELQQCDRCKKKLEHENCYSEKRQVFDIRIQRWITEYQSSIERCSCGHLNQAKFPEGVNAPVQYGNKVKAMAVYMNQYQLIPLDRTAEFFADQLGMPVNKSSIVSWVSNVGKRLEFFEEQAKDDLLASAVLHGDETGAIVDKERYWLHCLSNDHTTLYGVSPWRGSEAMDEMMVLPFFQGYLVHDFWSSYFKYDCIHIMCNAHLLRELTHAHEGEGHAWAGKMKKLLERSLLRRDDSNAGLSWDQILYINAAYDKILDLAEKECPHNSIFKKGFKGRVPQTKARNLLLRFQKQKSSILMFLYSKEIPFTNNQGERDLRMIKVQQKISGCFRTYEGAKNFCRIRSFISTMKKRGRSPEDALADIFARGT